MGYVFMSLDCDNLPCTKQGIQTHDPREIVLLWDTKIYESLTIYYNLNIVLSCLIKCCIWTLKDGRYSIAGIFLWWAYPSYFQACKWNVSFTLKWLGPYGNIRCPNSLRNWRTSLMMKLWPNTLKSTLTHLLDPFHILIRNISAIAYSQTRLFDIFDIVIITRFLCYLTCLLYQLLVHCSDNIMSWHNAPED